MFAFLKRLFTFGRNELYEQGIAFFNKHQYNEAISRFEAVLERKSSTSSLYRNLAQVYCGYAHRNLGVMLFATGNFSAALQEFERAISFNRSHSQLYHFIGICQNNLADFEGAVKTFKKILEMDPRSIPTKLKLGIALHNLQMWDRSVEIYASILEQQPLYADVHYRLGLALLGQSKPAEAVTAFQKALSINPRYTDARLKLGVTQAYLGHFDEAMENFNEILVHYPEFADVYYFKGIVYSGRNAIDAAIEAFTQALTINASYKDARIKLGILYCHRNNFKAGIEQFRQACASDTADQNLAQALDVISTVINAQTYSDEKTASLIGQFLGLEKPLAQTIREFNKHLKIAPDFSDILSIIKHFSEENTSLCSMLIPLVEDYIRLHPEYPDLHNTLGMLYAKTNKLLKAENAYKEAIRINPRYLNARINLFNTLHILKKNQEALEHGRYLSTQDAPYPDVYCTMSSVLLELDLPDEALQFATKAIDLRPRYASAHYIIGKIHHSRGDKDRAAEAYEHCLNSQPSPELSLKVKEAIYNLNKLYPA